VTALTWILAVFVFADNAALVAGAVVARKFLRRSGPKLPTRNSDYLDLSRFQVRDDS
jgi:hypothetical protein